MKKNTKKLLIKAKKDIFGELSGNNISLKSGDGFDFHELRPYINGEDIRRIDWKRSAKMSEAYVKLFHEEKELQILIIPLLSGSLHFGVKKLKLDLLCEIIALLGFSALKNGDRYSIIVYKKGEISSTKLSKKELYLYKTIENLQEQNLLGLDYDLKAISGFIEKRYKRRSLLVFIGDFWQIPHFKSLAKRHEILCINVRDNFEENPSALGQIKHINPNTLKRTNLVLDKNKIEQIKKNAKIHDKSLQISLIKQGVRVVKIYTSDNAYGKLKRFLR